MAAKQPPQKDLVGRPLVPFFTDEGHVNASLQVSREMAHEPMEVDARVWNAAQGYFEYPDHQAASPSLPTVKAKPTGCLLLTPQRLGTSIKDVRSQSREKTPPPAPLATPLPSSPSPQQQTAPSKKKGKKSSPNNDKQSAKTTKPAVSESKWAWSAFQNSPDPKSLPIPPFLSPPTLSHEPEPTPVMAPLTLGDKKPPSKPPNPPQVTILQRPKPKEEQMTLQLRKMLNIRDA